MTVSTWAAAALDAVPDGWLADADGLGVGFTGGGGAECVGGGTEAGIDAGGAECVGCVLGEPLAPVVGDPDPVGAELIPAGLLLPGAGVRGGWCEWHRPECAAHGRDDESCSARVLESCIRTSP
jgi:hypothetical protein